MEHLCSMFMLTHGSVKFLVDVLLSFHLPGPECEVRYMILTF